MLLSFEIVMWKRKEEAAGLDLGIGADVKRNQSNSIIIPHPMSDVRTAESSMPERSMARHRSLSSDPLSQRYCNDVFF